MINHLFAEFASTALMIVFGVGVHCDITLKGSKYRDSGHMFAITTWSFGISVCLFIFGGVCMNPAMALCQAIVGLIPWSSVAPFAIERLHVIGGGAQNDLLNQLTADACGIPVVAGPSEATAIGNVMVQARALGLVGSLARMRDYIRRSVEVREFLPRTK